MVGLEDRRAAVRDLLEGHQSPNARWVMVAALMGARQPRLPVGSLIAVGHLFDITPGATRTCLSRMVAHDELVADRGVYALTGRLLERRSDVDHFARRSQPDPEWDGTWEVAVVALDRRPAGERLNLRRAAAGLGMVELREGVWTRPANLGPLRQPEARRVVTEQCARFWGATTDLSSKAIGELFGLDEWAATAHRFLDAFEAEDGAPGPDDDLASMLQYHFVLSVAAVSLMHRDPQLPPELLPDDWPGPRLRAVYRQFERSFQARMREITDRHP
ncbi:MAG: PaaX family transcriptional regulator C-terminal domain-containing protein [Acidimicrobiales bacterium]